jgi:hypothetical protein
MGLWPMGIGVIKLPFNNTKGCHNNYHYKFQIFIMPYEGRVELYNKFFLNVTHHQFKKNAKKKKKVAGEIQGSGQL